uniref:Uncharacterized protein n=1 Tax=uncultured prokaryote TaxID=198431 RepID=A0A0H5Q413_9ZZZZ|nr:hypothetical protein [uncultured prokaryote]
MSTGAFAKLVIGGVIDTVQSWSVGISCVANTTPSDADLDAWLTDVYPLVSTWAGAANSFKAINKAACTINTLNAYGYSELGTTAASSAEYRYGTPIAGTNSTGLSSQLALVATFKTLRPGRHNTGRIYVPCTALVQGPANRVVTGTAQGLATATAGLLTALTGTIINSTETAAPIVPNSGAGPSQVITSVYVGDIVDTQRRRRDKYVETRYSANV